MITKVHSDCDMKIGIFIFLTFFPPPHIDYFFFPKDEKIKTERKETYTERKKKEKYKERKKNHKTTKTNTEALYFVSNFDRTNQKSMFSCTFRGFMGNSFYTSPHTHNPFIITQHIRVMERVSTTFTYGCHCLFHCLDSKGVLCTR